MTGQGNGSAQHDGCVVLVEVRAVNHRWLEVRSRLPAELADHTGAVEDTVRRTLSRGRIDVGVRVEGAGGHAAKLDTERATRAFQELTSLRDRLAPGEPVPLAILGAVPGLFIGSDQLAHTALRELLLEATEAACAAAAAMRVREGNALAADFAQRAAQLEGLVAAIQARGPQVIEAARKRLFERIERLLPDRTVGDAVRLEQEVALLADRSDVCEECTRLASHLAQLRDLVGGGQDGAAGRRLEFLLQEMARETNTLGQKSADVEIARAVIDLKVEIERMREQAQNIL
jgi:uncharacterized protein (TIGR00255 family)